MESRNIKYKLILLYQEKRERERLLWNYNEMKVQVNNSLNGCLFSSCCRNEQP